MVTGAAAGAVGAGAAGAAGAAGRAATPGGFGGAPVAPRGFTGGIEPRGFGVEGAESGLGGGGRLMRRVSPLISPPGPSEGLGGKLMRIVSPLFSLPGPSEGLGGKVMRTVSFFGAFAGWLGGFSSGIGMEGFISISLGLKGVNGEQGNGTLGTFPCWVSAGSRTVRR
jgi:hypothetical protein